MASTRKLPTPDILLKVIIVGDSGVGKTNLLTFFCEGVFKDSYVATIGVDFKIKMVQIDDKKVKLQIWDTAGQERFRNITQTYYKGAAGIILVYSIVDSKSFANVTGWIKQIESNSNQNVCKMLIGTKSDLTAERQVSVEEGSQLARKYGMSFFEVSSKEGKNVGDCFIRLTREIKEKRDHQKAETQQTIRLQDFEGNKQTEGCKC